MYKSLQLFTVILLAVISHAQKTDTIILHYAADQFIISVQDRNKIDSFLTKGWDRISIIGHTDETETEQYNLQLSRKRSREVYQYLRSKDFSDSLLSSQYFGELRPVGDNCTDEGKALNRRTEITGYRFPKIATMPKIDPMQPITKNFDNGLIITYRPGALPDYLSASLASGTGVNWHVIETTTEMRQYNLYNNTTNGEVLSSVGIICFDQLPQFELDSPVLIRIPIPFQTSCNLVNLKFFVAVNVGGERIWQEQSNVVHPEIINGRTYASVWLKNLSGCVNFDFKIPECLETDSARILVKAKIKKLTAELKGLNCVYLPRNVDDTTRSVLYQKDKLDAAVVSFVLYNGKKRIQGFIDQPLTNFPYDETTNQYVLATESCKFSFPRLNVFDVLLKVNKTKYHAYPENNQCDVVYLNPTTKKLTVDFTVIGKKGEVSYYKNLPLTSLPFDETTGCYVVDKDFLKTLDVKNDSKAMR